MEWWLIKLAVRVVEDDFIPVQEHNNPVFQY